jgi:hypothetical protein
MAAMNLSKQFSTFLGIMAFYFLLSYILFPFAFYFFIDKSLKSAGNGFIVGSLLSILLWIFFGSGML